MVQLMPPHPKPHQLLPHLNPFWYRLTQVVLEKRPLNGCSRNLGDNTDKTVIKHKYLREVYFSLFMCPLGTL